VEQQATTFRKTIRNDFSLFTNETASLTYNSNNNTPTAGLGTSKEACDQFYGVFEISQT